MRDQSYIVPSTEYEHLQKSLDWLPWQCLITLKSEACKLPDQSLHKSSVISSGHNMNLDGGE